MEIHTQDTHERILYANAVQASVQWHKSKLNKNILCNKKTGVKRDFSRECRMIVPDRLKSITWKHRRQ